MSKVHFISTLRLPGRRAGARSGLTLPCEGLSILSAPKEVTFSYPGKGGHSTEPSIPAARLSSPESQAQGSRWGLGAADSRKLPFIPIDN